MGVTNYLLSGMILQVWNLYLAHLRSFSYTLGRPFGFSRVFFHVTLSNTATRDNETRVPCNMLSSESMWGPYVSPCYMLNNGYGTLISPICRSNISTLAAGTQATFWFGVCWKLEPCSQETKKIATGFCLAIFLVGVKSFGHPLNDVCRCSRCFLQFHQI